MQIQTATVRKGQRFYRSGTKKVVEVVGVNSNDRTIEVRPVGGEETMVVDDSVFPKTYTRMEKKRVRIPGMHSISAKMIQYAEDKGLAIVRCGVYTKFGPETTVPACIVQAQVMSEEAAAIVNDAVFSGAASCRTKTEEMLLDLLVDRIDMKNPSDLWAKELEIRSPKMTEQRSVEIVEACLTALAKRSRAEVFAEIEARCAAYRAKMDADVKEIEERMAAREARQS